MKKEEIFVENLKCRGCANTIKRTLEKFQEVKKIEVDTFTSSVLIEYESGENMRQEFVDKLARLGYPEAGKGNVKNYLRSYVSCAVGRMK